MTKKRRHIRHGEKTTFVDGVKHKAPWSKPKPTARSLGVQFKEFDEELEVSTTLYADAISKNDRKDSEKHLKTALDDHYKALNEIYSINKTMDAVYNPQTIETAKYDKQDILDSMNQAIASYDRYVESTPVGIRAQDLSYDDLDSDVVQVQAIELLQLIERQVKETGFTANKIDDPQYATILNIHEQPLVLENIHLLIPRTNVGFEQDMSAFYTYLTLKLSPKDPPITTFALMKAYLDYRTLLWIKTR